MKPGDSLVKNLWQDVNADIKLSSLTELNVLLAEFLILSLVEHDLCKNLVGERARHDKGGVTSSTAKVDETTLSKEDDVTAILHEITVYLGLNVLDRRSVLLQPSDINLNIEVTDVYALSISVTCIWVE